jgi:hypothetical protein
MDPASTIVKEKENQMANASFEPGDEICPPWWPRGLWWLHFPSKVVGPPKGGGNPVNMPAEINQILLGLQAHTESYYLKDQAAVKQMREIALNQIRAGVEQLGKAR